MTTTISQSLPPGGTMKFPGKPVADPQSAWRDAMAADQGGLRTLYVHLPFCRCRCLFCPFYYGSGESFGWEKYVTLLRRELENAADSPLSRYPVNAVYFGGGTPTDLEPEQMAGLLDLIRSRFRLTNDCEITIEGRITGFDEHKMALWTEHGANRFSLGVQTFNTGLRQMVGRVADREQVLSTLRRLTSLNQASVVIDLLYGLPGQTMADWEEDQRIVLSETQLSGIDHYRLNIHAGLPLDRHLREGKLPPTAERDELFAMYCRGEDLMTAAGAVRLSIKHFALDYRERNANNDIAGRKNVCLPFGVHAGGRLGRTVFHQTDDLEEYRRLVTAGIKPLANAEEVLPGHEVCRILAGQISRQRGINLAVAAASDPFNRERILAGTEALLERWREERKLLSSEWGWLKLSCEAAFDHRLISAELFNAVRASYWE